MSVNQKLGLSFDLNYIKTDTTHSTEQQVPKPQTSHQKFNTLVVLGKRRVAINVAASQVPHNYNSM